MPLTSWKWQQKDTNKWQMSKSDPTWNDVNKWRDYTTSRDRHTVIFLTKRWERRCRDKAIMVVTEWFASRLYLFIKKTEIKLSFSIILLIQPFSKLDWIITTTWSFRNCLSWFWLLLFHCFLGMTADLSYYGNAYQKRQNYDHHNCWCVHLLFLNKLFV